MNKSCFRQLEALINTFNVYLKRFLKKPLYKAQWPKIQFLTLETTANHGKLPGSKLRHIGLRHIPCTRTYHARDIQYYVK